MIRTRANLLTAVAAVDVEHNPLLQRRDVTGDGIPETFCNVAARMILAKLGVDVPQLLANDLFDWLESEAGKAAGWGPGDKVEAEWCAERGCPVIAIHKSPSGHGHVAICVPALTVGGPHVAQAGMRNFSNEPLSHAFGNLPVSFFLHS